ncbi:MAG: sugar fermentation stimulation protein A [Desulforhopalus sp.]|jgi:sugar fermentation stimulation protein A
MKFEIPLIRGRLIKRYKRFLADIELNDGEIITAHCPNTGTMLSCSTPGSAVGLSVSDNPKRKYPHTLEMIQENSIWIGINTARTNGLVADAILNGNIQEFEGVHKIRREVKTSEHTRLDLHVFSEMGDTYVEVKNCSLAQNGCAMFPDARTTRGTKHLNELIRLKNEGKRSCIFFLVQRMDAEKFAPASHIDEVYGNTLMEAIEGGVMALAYQAEITPDSIEVVRSLPIIM